ncbi:amidophosphoribosyltransferase [Mycobacterium senegalense]|uniref:amidophosphoribosyltransferase n=1 Tax=Mycolicibacterium senegalense TaxID=1796 RepID=UPI0022239C83|nr:amidophosphoribosyltransferase [Mycolicibacterium senegalense]MCW1823149.1 amidophosphoribosyltransferase [Mycolicibacterium senegalense]
MTDYLAESRIRDGLGRVSYFRNIAPAGPGICRVCRQPTPAEVCSDCQGISRALDGLTCDQTFFLAYADGRNPRGYSQSAKTMRQYKAQPAPKRSVEDVHLLTNIVTWIHDGCIREAEDAAEWDVVTFVPSRNEHPGIHPVSGIALNVARIVGDDPERGGSGRIKRWQMAVGPVDAPRVADAGRFAASPASFRDKRVLLVDDTWTGGTSLQSAAAALKLAGAASVTGLCVVRWLSWNWSTHVPLLETVTAKPYDPFQCIAFDCTCGTP